MELDIFKNNGFTLVELKAEFIRVQNEILNITESESYELMELLAAQKLIAEIMYYDYDYDVNE